MSYIGKQPTKAPLTASDIEDGIITAAKIEDGAVVAAEIASNAVTTAKINADAVTGAKIADDSVDSEHLVAAGIDKEHLTDHLDIFAGTSLSAADLGAGIHIKTADSGASVNSGHDEIVAEGSGNSGISILSGTSSNGAVCFGDSGNNCIGYVNYDHTNNKLDFGTNGATQFSLDSSGNFLPAATDHGIYLGVTSSTASNLLNDYEEGTWTPGFSGTSSSPSGVNYTSRNGYYTKIGRLVFVNCYLNLSSWSSAGSGAVKITGLPFTASNSTNNFTAGGIGFTETFDADNAPRGVYVEGNTTHMRLKKSYSADSRDNISVNVSASAMNGNEDISVGITYFTDA